jgi:predicted metalloprotease with PDZ domain
MLSAIRSLMGLTAVVALLLRCAAAGAQPPSSPVEDPAKSSPTAATAARQPGYLGLITDERGQQGRSLRVVKVVEGSPAADAGFTVGDLILRIDGKHAGSIDEMSAELQAHSPGDKLRFDIERADNSQVTLEVVLGRRPTRNEQPFEFGRIPERLPEPDGGQVPTIPPAALPSARGLDSPVQATPRGQLLGIRTGTVSEDVRLRLGLPAASGARVVSRVVGSPAERAGIPLDALIVAVDGQPVASPSDLAQLIAAAGPGKEVELSYYAQGELRKTVVTLASPSGPPAASDQSPIVGAPPPPSTQPPLTLPSHTPPTRAADRIEQLERRIRELEQRVHELERAIGSNASPNRSNE